MEYPFSQIEQTIKELWTNKDVYKVNNESHKPKYYILDMFPYPSGAGLHVGHPLGYIASDIYARYKRMKGYNVLHPMGFDAFGLPAEQYALETGQHPAHTTEVNIARYKDQLNNIGFSFDWSREIRTSDPHYYKWTQWIFLQLFESWFDRKQQKARYITELSAIFSEEGNKNHPCPGDPTITFDSETWKNWSKEDKRSVLMHYRLAYLDYAEVWWCEALNTVLANDEVVNGVSERGAHPVIKRKMKQWFLRITEFADRLLEGLNKLDWSTAMNDMQRNWIGKSEGASIHFPVINSSIKIEVFTTRPDTIFGVDFLVVAPEMDWIESISDAAQLEEVKNYIQYVKSRSERERMAEKKISGVFTGAFAEHPITKKQIPIWISEYVLAGYGTGAIMAVPAGDERDHSFAKHFNIPITNIFGDLYNGETAISNKDAKLTHSDFLNNKNHSEALPIILDFLNKNNLGTGKVNYRMRDAGFSRQRYWGEPFPIVYDGDIPYSIFDQEIDLPEDIRQIPVVLPKVDSYGPGPEGEGPLANLTDWTTINYNGKVYKRETNTMPGYAGSSWYFLRYMDPKNDETFADRQATNYWQQVDLYIGGTEHAVGHLLYSRLWTKVLHDLDLISFDEPFKKLVNQGMIQGSSRFVYRINGENTFVSHGLINNYATSPLHVDVNLVNGTELDIEGFKNWRSEYQNANFILEDGKYYCGIEIEKMSKSKYNVVNPDDIVAQYGADVFRMYEMFLGPIEMSKPWETKGIEGVSRFVKKLWRLCFNDAGELSLTDSDPTNDELKILHKTIKKVTEDTERFSFNTCISQFMIFVNEISTFKEAKKSIILPFIKLMAPYAPYLSEYIYQKASSHNTILDADFPIAEEKFLIENTKTYPVAINGKPRTELTFALDEDAKIVETTVLNNEIVQKWMEGKPLKKFIFAPGKMINVVV